MNEERDLFRCCRDWICLLGPYIGHCGYCGERPVYVGPVPEEKDAE